ncbi:MAG: hypothetical protein VKL59_10460 [Nostocaceae cyanobacterium]|nr:hypothetical protein [Nostocaceae cyanobacterium]
MIENNLLINSVLIDNSASQIRFCMVRKNLPPIEKDERFLKPINLDIITIETAII